MLYRLAETVRVRTPPLVRDAQATWIGWVYGYAAMRVTTEKYTHWVVVLLKVYKAHYRRNVQLGLQGQLVVRTRSGSTQNCRSTQTNTRELIRSDK